MPLQLFYATFNGSKIKRVFVSSPDEYEIQNTGVDPSLHVLQMLQLFPHSSFSTDTVQTCVELQSNVPSISSRVLQQQTGRLKQFFIVRWIIPEKNASAGANECSAAYMHDRLTSSLANTTCC